jgi:succinyl-CoA synthetase beta subunit
MAPPKSKAKERKQKIFAEREAEDFLRKYLPVAKSKLVKTLREAESFSGTVGFPLVLKMISKQALHKTEVDGVKIVYEKGGLNGQFKSLANAAKRKKIRLDGILVQEYVRGKEVIIGLKKDPVFGHAILFGLGGTLVEILKDVAFRVCPISEGDAQEMIDELRLRQVLYGYRGDKGVNIRALKKILVNASKIPLKHGDIREMDINPLMINERGGKVADARIVFG